MKAERANQSQTSNRNEQQSSSMANRSGRKQSSKSVQPIQNQQQAIVQTNGLPTLRSHQKNLMGPQAHVRASSHDLLNQSIHQPQSHQAHPVRIPEENEPKFKSLQSQARASFKRILRLQGKLDKKTWSFFYLTNTVAASEGQHFRKIATLRQGMNEFRTQWMNFNQPLDTSVKEGRQPQKPNVLVVADEIFTMADKPLNGLARLSVPNTLKESNMVQGNRQNPNWRNVHGLQQARLGEGSQQQSQGIAGQSNVMTQMVQRQELMRQQQQWHSTVNVVQGHLFNGLHEQKDIKVFDYLMKFSHEIISFKMCERLIDCWQSQKVEWHVERGLKINMDGSPCVQGKPISATQILQLNQIQRRGQAKEAKMQTFAVSSFRPGSQTAHMASSGNQVSRHSFAHECHNFNANSPAQQKQLKMNLGPGVHVGKYDVHHLNVNAPLGTSIFQLQKEREFAEENQAFLTKKYVDSVKKQSQKLPPHEKRPAFIEEPQPGPAHVICAVCKERFSDYYQHIFSARHRKGVQQNAHTFGDIDQVIQGLEFRQKEKQEQQIQSMLQKGNSEQLNRLVDNPEEIFRNAHNICMTTEDTSSGSGALNKKSINTGEHESTTGIDDCMQKINMIGNEINMQSSVRQKEILTIDLDKSDGDEQNIIIQGHDQKAKSALSGHQRKPVASSQTLHQQLMQAALESSDKQLSFNTVQNKSEQPTRRQTTMMNEPKQMQSNEQPPSMTNQPRRREQKQQEKVNQIRNYLETRKT